MAPTAVAPTVNVVDDVVADDRAVGDAQGIDSSQVAHAMLAQVVDVVVADGITLGHAGAEAPRPAAITSIGKRKKLFTWIL